ncbi:MAG: gliding motility-associated C-terminal domain-containing protein [Flavobacteriia bacterium]
MMIKTILLSVVLVFTCTDNWAQNYVFGQLTGSPNMITTGWNLTGNAHIGDTPGDVDAFNNEMLLTNNSTGQSGGVFYNTPINLSACQTWTVDFEYRIAGGNAADGLAFCFLSVPPTGFVSGGGVGIPGTANGLKVVIDTYDNCSQGGTNPEIQIFNGIGYNECLPATPKIQNSGGSLNYLRNTNYQPVKITYNNGLVTVFVNNVQLLQATSPVNFTGYVGFTASTGALYDLHSIRNVTIYTNQAVSNAGIDANTCSNTGVVIGATPNPLNVYSWSPAVGLSSTTAANPTVTLPNTTGAPITQTYTVTTSLATNPGLCPTTDQINVTIYPQFSQTVTQTLCNGGPYVFNGQSLTQSGTYYDTLSTVHSCDSIVTLNLTIGNAQANAGPDISICSDEVGNLGVNPILGYFYSWSPATNLSANNLANPTVSAVNTTGVPIVQTYTLSTSSTSNPGLCPSSDQVQVTIFPKFVTNITDTLCNGGPYNFNGQSITQTGIYVDTLTSIHSCDSIVNLNIVISTEPVFTLSDTTICIGNPLTLIPQGVGGMYSYTWTPQMSIPTSAGAMTWNPTVSNEFFLLATNNYGCTHLDSLELTVNPLPIMGLVASSQALCPNQSLMLTASGAATYSWSGPGATSSTTNSQTIIPTGSGVFNVVGYTAQGCVDSIQTNFTLYPKPVLTITADQDICDGQMASITVSGASNYVWNPATLNGTQVYVSPIVTTNYSVIGFNQFNCSDTVSSIVTVHPNPVAMIGAEPYLLTSDSPIVSFTNLSSGQVISTWNFDDGTIQQQSNTNFDYQYPYEEGDYMVQLVVESQFGCFDSTTQLIQVKGDVLYYVPNAFTPDGDEHNNMFNPVFTSGFDPLTYQFDVYDRWGELIFSSQNPQIGWDGYLNFVKCQEGMYLYNIRFTETKSGEYRFITGHLNLMK